MEIVANAQVACHTRAEVYTEASAELHLSTIASQPPSCGSADFDIFCWSKCAYNLCSCLVRRQRAQNWEAIVTTMSTVSRNYAQQSNAAVYQCVYHAYFEMYVDVADCCVLPSRLIYTHGCAHILLPVSRNFGKFPATTCILQIHVEENLVLRTRCILQTPGLARALRRCEWPLQSRMALSRAYICMYLRAARLLLDISSEIHVLAQNILKLALAKRKPMRLHSCGAKTFDVASCSRLELGIPVNMGTL